MQYNRYGINSIIPNRIYALLLIEILIFKVQNTNSLSDLLIRRRECIYEDRNLSIGKGMHMFCAN